MKDYSQGIEAIRREQVRLQALCDLADMLESAQSIEGATASAVARADKANAERDAAIADLAAARADIASANSEASALISDANSIVADMLTEARRLAEEVGANAAADAERIKAEARKQAEDDLQSITQKRDAMSEEITYLTLAKSDAQAVLDVVVGELANRQAALARVQAAIAEARA